MATNMTEAADCANNGLVTTAENYPIHFFDLSSNPGPICYLAGDEADWPAGCTFYTTCCCHFISELYQTTFYYRIYPKYSGTIIPNHTGHKI